MGLGFFEADLAESLRREAAEYADTILRVGNSLLDKQPGGVARRGFDFSFEALQLNEDIAVWMRSGVMPLYDTESGFPVCPPELLNAEALAEAMRDSVEEIVSAMAHLEPEKWQEEVEFDNGAMISGFGLLVHALDHMAYHHGQLSQLEMLG